MPPTIGPLPVVSPLVPLVVLLVAALVAALLARYIPYFRRLVDSSASRLAPLDGLRGLLALGVFVHHSAVNLGFMATGYWVMPANPLLAYLGPGSVSLFFMASGFLFWAKAIDKKLDAESLLRSRFWRVMPMYLATALAVSAIAGWLSHWKLQVDPIYFRREIAFALTGGYFSVLTFNGVLTLPINSGVTWSLLFEWWFYFSLPLLAVFAAPKRFVTGLVLFFALREISPVHFPEYANALRLSTGFAFGMSMAYLVRVAKFRDWMRRRWVAVVAVLSIAGGLIFNQRYPTWAISFELMSLPLFAAVSCGNNVFRILTRRWTLLLGHISYSIYLVHGIVLFFLVQRALGPAGVAHMTSLRYWAWIAGVATPLLVILCALTYRCIEAPFLGRASTRTRVDPQSRASEEAVAAKRAEAVELAGVTSS